MAFRHSSALRVSLVSIGVLVAAALIVLTARSRDRLTGTARRQWRNQAVASVGTRLADGPWLAAEVAQLQATAASSRNGLGGWAGDHLLVMRNGDWVVCENICSKENPRIHDLFIGRGSDGRWYYSTFHFCIDHVVLANASQPDSLAQFADAYWLAPFDGRSDDCLKVTWTSGTWGDEKIAEAIGPATAASH